MRWLAIVLLVGVFVRHDTSYLASTFTPLTPGAWFTVMGGLWEIILCSVVLLMAPSLPLLTAAMWIGMLEGAQISACRAVIVDIRPVPPNVNLCDYAAGWHVGATMTGVYLFIVCPAIGKAWRGYLGRRYEVGLGVTLAVIVAIGGNEIAHLVSPIAALLVMAGACIAGIAAYERAT